MGKHNVKKIISDALPSVIVESSELLPKSLTLVIEYIIGADTSNDTEKIFIPYEEWSSAAANLFSWLEVDGVEFTVEDFTDRADHDGNHVQETNTIKYDVEDFHTEMIDTVAARDLLIEWTRPKTRLQTIEEYRIALKKYDFVITGRKQELAEAVGISYTNLLKYLKGDGRNLETWQKISDEVRRMGKDFKKQLQHI